MSDSASFFKPVYQHLCKYCGEVEVTLSYEDIGRDRYRWICRNANTGSIHNCVNSYNRSKRSWTQ